MNEPLISTPELLLELGSLVGHTVRIVERQLLPGQPIFMVWPADLAMGRAPFWQAVKTAAMETEPACTPEEAVVAFAAGAKGWMAAAAKQPAVDVSSELRGRLAAGPVPAKQLLADFDALGVSQDRLGRVARRLGVQRRKTGMAGGWTWQLPAEANTEVSGAACQEVGAAFINQDLEEHHEHPTTN